MSCLSHLTHKPPPCRCICELTLTARSALVVLLPVALDTSVLMWQAVIFLFEHDDTSSAGFILNKPTEHKLGRLVGADELCPEFADNLLYLGGDVGSDTMHFIHGYTDIQVCGLPSAASAALLVAGCQSFLQLHTLPLMQIMHRCSNSSYRCASCNY